MKLSRMLGVVLVAGGLALAGCGGGKKADTTPPGGGGAGDEPVSSPTGAGPSCEQEIALECANGMVDGCVDGKTTIHVCVAADAAAGPPCEQELALECPADQIDACLMTPAAAQNHICVVK